MIDTVRFRVHDLEKHKGLVAFLHRRFESGKERVLKSLDNPYNPNSEIKMRRYFIDHASGRSYPETYNSHLKSYNYDVSYYINFREKGGGFIEFNLSLPKYYFGNNVMQLVPHYYDKYMDEYRVRNYYDLGQFHFMMFKAAFNHFLNKEFLDQIPEKRYIQIIQIDFAFNLLFNSSDELNIYMHYIRSVKKRYARSDSGHNNHYDTSIFYPSSTHTFKIYHKGPEFKKHDYRKIVNRGKKNKNFLSESEYKTGLAKRKERADRILSIANRILRFEVAFKIDAMSDLWWYNQSPEHFRTKWKAYSSYNSNGWFEFNGNRYPVEGSEEILEERMFYKLPDELKKFLKDGKHLYGRKVKMFLDSNERFTSVDNFSFQVPFNYGMFKLLLERFRQITAQYHLGKTRKIEIIGKAVNYQAYGTTQSLSLRGYRKPMIKNLAELLRTKSWYEIWDMGIMSENTYYKYREFFKKMGYSDVNTEDNGLQDVDYTYCRYYDIIFPNWDLVTELKKFPFDY